MVNMTAVSSANGDIPYGVKEVANVKDPSVNRALTMSLDKEVEILQDLMMLSEDLGRHSKPPKDFRDEPREQRPGTIDFAKKVYEMLLDISVEINEIRIIVNGD